jgi:NADPH:quinone reductase-like Zn-dependent oxidoreductase
MFIAKIGHEDLDFLRDFIEAGKMTTIIDKTYPLSEAPVAFRYLENEHARGKIVITME